MTVARILRWEAPSPDLNGAGRQRSNRDRAQMWQPVADELRANPGRWALIHESADAGRRVDLAFRICRGEPKAFAPAGDYEAVTRTRGGGLRVYARYLGDGDT